MRIRPELTLAAFLLIAVAAGGGLSDTTQSQAATPTPTATAKPGSVARAGPGSNEAPLTSPVPSPDALQPCPIPGPSDGKAPAHPPQLGDKFCDARRFAVPTNAPIKPAYGPGSDPHERAVGVGTADSNGYYGLYGERVVTPVTLKSATGILYATQHSGVNPNGPNGGWWIEAGWAIFGSAYTGSADCPVNQYLVFADGSGFTDGYPQYAIGIGSDVWLMIVSDGVSQWYSYILWNGTWNLILSSGLDIASTPQINFTDETYSYGQTYVSYPETNVWNANVLAYQNGWQWITWPDSYWWADYPYYQNSRDPTSGAGWYGCLPGEGC